MIYTSNLQKFFSKDPKYTKNRFADYKKARESVLADIKVFNFRVINIVLPHPHFLNGGLWYPQLMIAHLFEQQKKVKAH